MIGYFIISKFIMVCDPTVDDVKHPMSTYF